MNPKSRLARLVNIKSSFVDMIIGALIGNAIYLLSNNFYASGLIAFSVTLFCKFIHSYFDELIKEIKKK